MMTDPIADMLTRIRNGLMARKEAVLVPASTLKLAIARILKEEGFIKDVEVVRGQPGKVLRIHLAYTETGEPVLQGLRRVSTPGRRIYVGRDGIPRVRRGLGITILSTSQGVMTGAEARRRGIGGELLCEVW